MEYDIISSDDSLEMVRLVKARIADGWKPIGGVSAHNWIYHGRDGEELRFEYVQAMLKESNDKDQGGRQVTTPSIPDVAGSPASPCWACGGFGVEQTVYDGPIPCSVCGQDGRPVGGSASSDLLGGYK